MLMLKRLKWNTFVANSLLQLTLLSWGEWRWLCKHGNGSYKTIDNSSFPFLQREDYFRRRSRSASPARSVGRPRSRSPGRKARGRSRSPSRSPRKSRKPATPATKKPIEQQSTTSTPRRRGRPPKAARTPEIKGEERVLTPGRVTRSVTKTLVKEEKEALLIVSETHTKMSSKHKREYEFGGPLGAFFMMLGLPIAVLALYIFCNEGAPCTFNQKPKIPPLWGSTGAFFDKGHLIVDAWLVIQVLFYLLPIGKVGITVMY